MPLAGLKYKKLIGKLQTENYFRTPADVIVFRKGDLAVAIKGDTKETIASSTDHAEVIQKAIDRINNEGRGGRIILGHGSYKITETITVPKGITISGISQGDDTVPSVVLWRTFDGEIFLIDGDRVTIKNLILNGRESDTRDFISCSSAHRFLKFEQLTFGKNGGGGINLNGSYWVEIINIRPLILGDYAIKNTAGSPVGIYIRSVWGYQTNGLVNFDPVTGFVIENIGTDYYPSASNPMVRIKNSTGVIEDFDFEGSDTDGFPVNIFYIIGSRVSIIGGKLRNCGDPNDPWNVLKVPIYVKSGSFVTLDTVHFNLTKSSRDFMADATSIIKTISVQFAKGAHGYLTKNSGVATLSGDGSTTDFLIGEHGLLLSAITDPSKAIVKCTPASADAIAASPLVCYLSDENSDGKYESVRVKFASAPASGTDNVKVVWEVEYIG